MKKILLIAAVSAASFAVTASVSADIRVTGYPLGITDSASTVCISWDNGLGLPVGATLLYGTASNAYPVTIAAGSTGTFCPVAADIGMTGGAYYFRLSNTADGSWSNEYRIFITKKIGMQLTDITHTPNPFSPTLGDGRLKIRYVPQSDTKTSVKVTIKAYTMDGKLVADIVRGEVRTVGVLAEDTWDGKTNSGYYAKNGRYIIQIEAEDSTKKVQYLNTVIMVR